MQRPTLSRWAVGLAVLFAACLALTQIPSAAARVAVTVSISPLNSLTPINNTRQFTATVSGGMTNTVTWSISPPAGVDPLTIGTINAATGLYTAPTAPLPNFAPITVKATSVDDSTVSAMTTITVRNQIPYVTSVVPSSIPLGAFTLTVNGSRFVNGATVLWNGAALTTNYVSTTQLTATGNATQAGLVNVTVANPGPGAVSTPALQVGVSAGILVNLLPGAVTLVPNATQQFAVSIANSTNKGVTWAVNGIAGGNATYGSITASGLYTAPGAALPSTITVTATSVVDNVSKGTAYVTVQNPSVNVAVAPVAPTLQVGATQQFTATVTGNANQAVTWRVNGQTGGNATNGFITANGLYTAPSVIPSGAIVVSALSQADNLSTGTGVVTLQDPQALMFARLLDQTTFGVTPTDMAHVKQVGLNAYLDEQFAASESPWPALATAQRSDAVDAFVNNQLYGQDQLRQRVIMALSEIIVIAMNKNTNGDEIVPWLQLLSRNAFGNYRTLLKELTLEGSMGKYLDLVNSGGAGAANENYPREVMQLFSIGLFKLNLDGSQQLDAQNQPIPIYTQTDVQQLALALTGWTYNSPTGTVGGGGNNSYYPGPMLPMPSRHNPSQKTVLGTVIPAGQTIQQDLDSAINIIFNHPNVGPFLATRLIRALVTSNPSPAYIARVAAVFNDNGQGVRGDMTAVIRAIITDTEARNDTPPANFGRLRTPMQHTLSLVRTLGLGYGQPSTNAYIYYGMNEGILDAPSVFGHYSPTFRIPKGNGLFGPEFQIYTPSEAINRANLFYGFFYNPWPINPKLQSFVNIASDVPGLINAVDNTMLQGRMLPQTRAALLNALPAVTDLNQRVITAVYLTAMSGEYLVQR